MEHPKPGVRPSILRFSTSDSGPMLLKPHLTIASGLTLFHVSFCDPGGSIGIRSSADELLFSNERQTRREGDSRNISDLLRGSYYRGHLNFWRCRDFPKIEWRTATRRAGEVA